MKFSTGMTLAALAVLSAGCASKKPEPPAVAAPEAPAPAPEAPSSPSAPASVSSAPAASLQEQFAAAAGDRVYFEVDSSQLSAAGMEVVARQAEWLSTHPQLTVLIAGNCDERGTREYNLALGARRAQSVLAVLTSRGVSPDRVRTISYGKERPIDGGSGEEAWARNRNAHTMIQG